MTKDYQKRTARTSTPTESLVPVVPDVVSVAMSEIAADVREGLLAIAVGAGLQVMAAMMAADAEALCGPRGKHDPTNPQSAASVRPSMRCVQSAGRAPDR